MKKPITNNCFIFSLLSWLLLIITGWISLKWLKSDEIIIWTIHRLEISEGNENYYPFQMHTALIYMVFLIAMIITLIGFIFYIIKTIIKKDEAVYNGMMGQWSKFHFVPLLCVSILFIIGENSDNESYKSNENHYDNMSIAGFVFTIIGLISLIFIYIMTNLKADWYIILTIKKVSFYYFNVVLFLLFNIWIKIN